MSIVFYLFGALVIGYLFGYAFAKAKIGESLGCKVKELQEVINQKNLDKMNIKKQMRKENRENIHLKSTIDEYKLNISKHQDEITKLKKHIKQSNRTILEKESVVTELETLILGIQGDYALLEDEINEKNSLNNEQYNKLIQLEKDYKESIEKLTEKANDLYMVKGTDELKNAKDVFDNLREKATKKH